MKKGQVYEGIVEYVDFPDKAVVITKVTDETSIKQEDSSKQEDSNKQEDGSKQQSQEYHVTVKGHCLDRQ